MFEKEISGLAKTINNKAYIGRVIFSRDEIFTLFHAKRKMSNFKVNCRRRPIILKCIRQIVFKLYDLVLKCVGVRHGESWNDMHTESSTTEY